MPADAGFVRFILAVVLVLLLTVPTAFAVGYVELKAVAFMQSRIGPDRTSPLGTLQAAFHGFKMLAREDSTPTRADPILYTLAPMVVFLAPVMSLLVIPFAPGLFGQDLNIGLLYFIAVGGLTSVGLLLAGWSSYNKYSLLGGLRAAAQMVSYEIPLALAVVGVIILAGSMSLSSIVAMQAGSVLDWNVWRQPLGFLVFFIAATAEANRTPFDLPEADQEIVAGHLTEYTGMRYGFFYFAEYVNVFVASAFTVTLFFGGWNAPFDWRLATPAPFGPGSLGTWLPILLVAVPVVGTVVLALPFWLRRPTWPAWHGLVAGFALFGVTAAIAIFGLAYATLDWIAGLTWFLLKSYALVFLFVWIRVTLPRVRVDQLMGFAWKWLLPAALVNLFVTAAAVLVVEAM